VTRLDCDEGSTSAQSVLEGSRSAAGSRELGFRAKRGGLGAHSRTSLREQQERASLAFGRLKGYAAFLSAPRFIGFAGSSEEPARG